MNARAQTNPIAADRNLTEALAEKNSEIQLGEVSLEACTVAKQCLLDWLGVTIAARRQPLVEILVADAFADGAPGDACTIIARPERTAPLAAVLINGAMGHALDFDDAHASMGHPTAPLAPLVLAVAEQQGASGAAALEAFIAGFETECRVGAYMGVSHYDRGWHGTSTLGAFGAAGAAARLLALDLAQTTYAFGLAGTQAAGLKSVFGTMTKPFHPGKAAQNGLLAARLAKRGFTSASDILGAVQGFGETQSDAPDVMGLLGAPAGGYRLPDTIFKYHASCLLTHSSIEACAALVAEEGVTPTAIEAVSLRVAPGHLRVCNIEAPRTGLECKFSLRMMAALALSGEDTSNEALFQDALAARPDLVALRGRVTIDPTGADGTEATVTLTMKDGRRLARTIDASAPQRDLALQQRKLEAKFRRLVTPHMGAARADEVVAAINTLEDAPDMRAFMKLLAA